MDVPQPRAAARRPVLWIEADETRMALRRAQLPPRYALTAAATAAGALRLLSRGSFWLVVVTDELPDMPALCLVPEIRQRAPAALVMFCSDTGDFRLAGEAVERGAHALLSRSCSQEELLRRLRWLENHPPGGPAALEPAGDRLQRVRSYVDSHIGQPIRQQEVLDVACLSRSALHRYLRRTLGMSYAQYVSSRRVQRAKQLLAGEDIPIYQVAAEAGFQDSAYFSRWFKQAAGASPLAYRNALRGRKSAMTIGALVPLSGAYGDIGPDFLTGIEFAAASIAREVGVELSIHPIDTETCPARAAQKVYDAAQQLNIRHFTGCASSAVVAEVARAVEATGSVLVTPACAGLSGRLGSRDFRPLFQQARAAKAHTIALLNYGGDTEKALPQAREMGICDGARLIVVWSNGLRCIRRLGAACSQNVLFGTQYWEDADLPANNLLRRSWFKQLEQEPTYPNVAGYIGALMLHMAFQKTGSGDPEATRAALAGLEWEGLTAAREHVNADTHWTHKEYFLLQVDPSGAVTALAG